MPHTDPAVTVPAGYPTSTVLMDESGSKATANDFFAVAAVKLRSPGSLAREIKAIRDRHGYTKELKFNTITRASSAVLMDVINALEDSDAHLAATVVQGSVYNPFSSGQPVWKVHAEVMAQLLVGCINRRELVAVLMDAISTPAGESLEESVRQRVNSRFKATAVISAVCLDSKSTDLLQVADLVASSIMHQRRQIAGLDEPRDTYKDRVARRLAATFERPGFEDGRSRRLNVETFRGGDQRRGRPRSPSLSVVDKGRSAG